MVHHSKMFSSLAHLNHQSPCECCARPSFVVRSLHQPCVCVRVCAHSCTTSGVSFYQIPWVPLHPVTSRTQWPETKRFGWGAPKLPEGAFQDGSSSGNGLSESCWSLLATSVKSVCVHLLECNQQKFGWSQIPDIQTWQFLTHVTWETPRKVFCCGTALMDCSMHQCWAASRPSAVSASGYNLKDSPPAMDFLDLSRSPKAAWANFQP